MPELMKVFNPFGGVADSGLGAYSVGASAAAFYTTEHAVYNQYA